MSRSAAILCPGPSVTSTWPETQQQYDDVIAVNMAAKLVDDAWWLFSDSEAFTLRPIDPKRLRIITSLSVVRKLWKDGHAPRLAAHRRVYVTEVLQPRLVANPYSIVIAAFFAAALGAKRIDLYGVDWTEGGYMDGLPRTDPLLRWPVEIGMATSAFAWLRRRFGVEIRRCLPPGHPPPPKAKRMLTLSDRELDALGVHVLAPGEIERGRIEFEEHDGKLMAVAPQCMQGNA